MTCDFAYVKPVGEVKSATFDKDTKKLVVTGIDLPTMVKPAVTDLTGVYTADAAAALADAAKAKTDNEAAAA
jgi:hypothetical protein